MLIAIESKLCLKWFGEFKVKMKKKKRKKWQRIRAKKERKNHRVGDRKWMNAKWKSTKRFCYSTLLSIIDVSTTLRHIFLRHLMKPIKVDLLLLYVLSWTARKIIPVVVFYHRLKQPKKNTKRKWIRRQGKPSEHKWTEEE